MKKNDVLLALKQLKEIMQRCKDKRCYAIVRRVSSSGMSRTVHFAAIDKKGNYYNIDNMIHRITGYKYDNFDGLRVGGCGMDMIFNTLYIVNSYALQYGIVKKTKKKDKHYQQYHGVINTSYNYF